MTGVPRPGDFGLVNFPSLEGSRRVVETEGGVESGCISEPGPGPTRNH